MSSRWLLLSGLSLKPPGWGGRDRDRPAASRSAQRRKRRCGAASPRWTAASSCCCPSTSGLACRPPRRPRMWLRWRRAPATWGPRTRRSHAAARPCVPGLAPRQPPSRATPRRAPRTRTATRKRSCGSTGWAPTSTRWTWSFPQVTGRPLAPRPSPHQASLAAGPRDTSVRQAGTPKVGRGATCPPCGWGGERQYAAGGRGGGGQGPPSWQQWGRRVGQPQARGRPGLSPEASGVSGLVWRCAGVRPRVFARILKRQIF